MGLLSAYVTGTVESEATAERMLWLGWGQVHEAEVTALHMHPRL